MWPNRVWTLGELADSLEGTLINAPDSPLRIDTITAFSKRQEPGALFVAVRGAKADGHDHLAEAFHNGAVAGVVEDPLKLGKRPGIVVRDTRKALSRLAAIFAGHPSADLITIGITGTNGKTTINWILYHLLNRLNMRAVRIGTLGVKSENGFERPGDLTTPNPIQLQRDLRCALDLGAQACVMEVSSHALAQSRAADVFFDVAIFSNLSRDHLDYHLDMESYFAAKCSLFQLLAKGPKKSKLAVVNNDCSYGKRIIDRLEALGLHNFSFGVEAGSVVRIIKTAQSMRSSKVVLGYRGSEYIAESSLIGDYNAENIAAAFASLVALGHAADEIVSALRGIPQVPGRLELVAGQEFLVFVDYAHSPDALKRALQCLRKVTEGKLWVVFGCGGDRDKGKRPQMAETAYHYADHVVVTSDNPRSEDPLQIIDDILSGPTGVEIRKNSLIEPDRRLAIEKVLNKAAKGDVVLIAGKGHEDYQIIGTEKIHFSDQEEVRRILGLAQSYAA